MKHFTRTLKFLLAATLAIGSWNVTNAQTTVTVGTQTGTTSYLPIYSCYGYTYSQIIYTAADLHAAGLQVGTIDQISFYLSSGSSSSSDNWNVLLGTTNQTTFANTTSWVSSTSLTSVFNGTVVYPSGGNWLTISLSTPFDWNGVDNIVVAIDENASGYYCSDYWGSYTTSGNKGIYYRNDATNPDPASPPTATSTTSTVPVIRFEYIPAPDCAGTPAHAATTANLTNVCPGTTVNMGIDQTYFNSGLTYAWEQNDGSGWTAVSGATSQSFSTAVNSDMMYREITTCTVSGLSDIADPISISAYNIDSVHVSENSVATCSGEPAMIVASNVTSYSWSPSTGLTPSTTEDTVYLLPSSSTTYTVTGTDANGCITTANTHITPVTAVSADITTDPSENCTPGNIVTFQVTNIPPIISNGGNWEYRFIGVDGQVVQDWSTTNNYTFIPAQDSVYGYYYQIRSNSCPTDHLDSTLAQISIGFGADVTLTHYDCNTMGGSISLSNIFGQTTSSVVYQNDFNSSADLSSVTLSGAAVAQSDRIQLTASAASQSGYAMVTNTNLLGLNNSMNVQFVITADQPLNNYGTGGGDGITYSFGDDATPSGSGNNINGRGTKLRLSFDSADNSTENGNVKGIYLVYGWTANNAFGPSSSAVLAYSNNITWKGATDVPVEMNISADGKATVTVGGTVVFQNVQLPAAYMSADVTNWKHLFQAATGGDALRFTVADVNIATSSLSYGISQSASMPSTWQQTTTFDGLLPGTYHVWIAKADNSPCNRDIATVEILNNNPVVNLGNDTTICEGSSLILDAGNPGAVYTWSGTNTYTQTYEVSQTGNYIVNVTNQDGCSAIGSIQVTVQSAPTATGINVQENAPSVFLAVTGAQNTDSYNWNFGDGNTLMSGPASVAHSYAQSGSYTVTVELVNDCGSTTLTQQVTNSLGLEENNLSGVSVYPNPATSAVTISIENNTDSKVAVYAATGQLVIAETTFNGKTQLNISDLNAGIYLVNIQNEGKTAVIRLSVK